MYNREDQMSQESLDHIFSILNNVKDDSLPVSDALDTLAYWFHEAFQSGEISVEQPDPEAEVYEGEDIWT